MDRTIWMFIHQKKNKTNTNKKTSLAVLFLLAIVDASNLIMSNRVLTARNKTLELPFHVMRYLKKPTEQI